MQTNPARRHRTFGRRNSTESAQHSTQSRTLEIERSLPTPRYSGGEAFRFSPVYYELRAAALSALFSELDDQQIDNQDRNLLLSRVAEQVVIASRVRRQHLERNQADQLTRDLLDDLVGFGPLEDVLHDPDVTDIMVVGPKRIFIEKHGRLHETAIEFQDDFHLLAICQRIARRIGRRIDESSPMCDARLPDGSRVNIIVPPLAIDGPSLTVRKFQTQRLSFAGLRTLGALDEACIAFLNLLVRIRCNLMVVGGTGSGKTTFLNSLNQSLLVHERIVTCEDAAELQLQQRHIVRLETRSQNLEGTGEVTMRALIRNSLRMRPDRIIVGEVRGEEAFDFIQAMNTGHDGSMGTMHANSCEDALSRLEGLISLGAPSLPIRTIQKMMTSAIDIIIEVRRFRDGSRKLADIHEIIGLDEHGIKTRSVLTFKQDPTEDMTALSGSYAFFPITAHRILKKADHAGLLDAITRFSGPARLESGDGV